MKHLLEKQLIEAIDRSEVYTATRHIRSIIKSPVNENASLRVTDEKSNTFLHLILAKPVSENNIKIANAFFDVLKDDDIIFSLNEKHESFLWLAAKNGYQMILEAMLPIVLSKKPGECGYNLWRVENLLGQTLLHASMLDQQTACLSVLIKHVPHQDLVEMVNLLDEEGRTVLHHQPPSSIFYNHLIELNPDWRLVNNKNQTPFDILLSTTYDFQADFFAGLKEEAKKVVFDMYTEHRANMKSDEIKIDFATRQLQVGNHVNSVFTSFDSLYKKLSYQTLSLETQLFLKVKKYPLNENNAVKVSQDILRVIELPEDKLIQTQLNLPKKDFPDIKEFHRYTLIKVREEITQYATHLKHQPVYSRVTRSVLVGVSIFALLSIIAIVISTSLNAEKAQQRADNDNSDNWEKLNKKAEEAAVGASLGSILSAMFTFVVMLIVYNIFWNKPRTVKAKSYQTILNHVEMDILDVLTDFPSAHPLATDVAQLKSDIVTLKKQQSIHEVIRLFDEVNDVLAKILRNLNIDRTNFTFFKPKQVSETNQKEEVFSDDENAFLLTVK